MSLLLITTPDGDLSRVQQNVKIELDKLEAAVPSPRAPSTAVTADYIMKLTDAVVLAKPVTSLNVTLPPATTSTGLRFTVKNTSTAGTVHVRGRYAGNPDLIDGLTRLDLAAGARATCFSDGVAWWSI